MEMWAKKDPILNYENYLLDTKVLDQDLIDSIRKDFKDEINQAWLKADQEKETTSLLGCEINDVFRRYKYKSIFKRK